MSTRGSLAGGYSSFPRLQSATFEPLSGDGEVEVTYRSGASFRGQVQDHKRIGRGIFTWPNGARYEGEFSNNVRTGSGVQNWPDGSKYDGQFHNDLRHGDGKHIWANQESYSGRFFQDRRHGNGTYTWPDGSTFVGSFYMDRKEGFGVFQFANGNKFEGLYHEDEREGPGVMAYPDGTQDIGLWHGEKLVKICSAIPEAFSMKNHKDFDYDAKEHIKYLDMDDLTSREAFEKSLEDNDNYTQDNKVTEKVSDMFNIVLDPKSLAINKEAFDKEFYPKVDEKEREKEKDSKVKVWNNTPSMVVMQKHYIKHRHGKKVVSVSVDKMVAGERGKGKKKGALELASEELIEAATEGNVNKVEDLLTSGKVSPDVGDKNGHTPLIGASVNWHIDVINCLLNHGADVNKLSDEGCSALSASCIFFYPIESFRFNIAERYLKQPKHGQKRDKTNQSNNSTQQQQQQQQPPQPSQPPKSILSKKQLNVTKTDSNGQLDTVGTEKESLSKDAKNNQNMKQTPRQQVRIEDNVTSTEGEGERVEAEVVKEEFDSDLSLQYYEIEVSDNLIERCATQLSVNEKVVGGRRSHNSAHLGRARHLAVIKNERERMKQTLDILLRRGADPNASGVPMPALFFAIKAADVDMVKSLLARGASTSSVLPQQKGGLAPLHIAAAIPGEEGVQITELLLKAGADPNVRAGEDDSFLNTTLMDEWSKDPIPEESEALLGGRTALQIACARDDCYKNSTRVVRLLLDHKADTNLMCNGFSPLALCIASGNDMAVDELLVFGNEVSLPLTHGVGSALCAATNTEYEYRRPISARLHLIDKLVRAGANVLAPIAIGPKRLVGTVVDYAYYIFYQDTYIAKTPYHALTHAERETFIDRRKLLDHVGDLLRVKAVDREKRRMDDEQREGGVRSVSPSSGFVYIGAGAPLPPDARRPKFLRNQGAGEGPSVKFEGPGQGSPENGLPDGDDQSSKEAKLPRSDDDTVFGKKPLFKYCYQCGRSVFVRLSACTRCKEVYYCSKACKLKAWNSRHKEECIRVGGRSRSPSPNSRKQRSDSPTPATNPDKGRKTTVAELSKDKQALRVHPDDAHMGSLKGMLNELGFDIDKTEEAYGSRPTSGRQGSCHTAPSRPSSRPTLSASTIRSRPGSGQVPRKGLSKSAKSSGDHREYKENYSFN